MTLVC
jgi:hypothetical protein